MGEANRISIEGRSRSSSVPQEASRRMAYRRAAEDHVKAHGLVPPVSLDALRAAAIAVTSQLGMGSEHLDFVMVLVSNALWREAFVSVPFDQRILFLPQCLRSADRCQAQVDEMGLLCELCGQCPMGGFVAEAEDLGYSVIISEGTPLVTALLERGHGEAVLGVGCLSVLEKTFPFMARDAVPGLAIPLLRDGCCETQVDEAWLREAIRLRSQDSWLSRSDVEAFREEIGGWFQEETLRTLLDLGHTETERIALSWMARGGKRWRPLITVCVVAAMRGFRGQAPETLKRVAMAVECFHKASLVHDDIEDMEEDRYGQASLPATHGIPIALNVGDFLLGQGYRLMAEAGLPPDQVTQLFRVAAEGHCRMCLGQGEELSRPRDARRESVSEVLAIFANKTGPAFEVALRVGAICAGADDRTHAVLRRFSDSLGIAYQIRDDLQDFDLWRDAGEREGLQRPSLVLSLAMEVAEGAVRDRLAEILSQEKLSDSAEGELREIWAPLRIENRLRMLLEEHRHAALTSLTPLRGSHLKIFLHRVAMRILKEG